MVKLQLKAASTAFILFLFASLTLFALVRGVGNVAAALPLPKSLPSYSPLQTIGALLDLRPLIAIGAGILLVAAIVLIVRSAFLDRAVYMLASMLTLVLASIIGIVAGFAAFVAVTEHRLIVPQGIIPAAICFAIVLFLSFTSLDSLRRSLLLRTMLVPILAIGAPVLLVYGG
jgi:hypothetical protein